MIELRALISRLHGKPRTQTDFKEVFTMLLQEPVRTPYDITVNLFGFEVRTSIFFFVLPLILGRGLIPDTINPGLGLLAIAGVFWVSVLVHELGHAWAFRRYGVSSRIVLYWMGGLAIPSDGGTWMAKRSGSLTPQQRIIISLAGPVAGLLLAAAMCLVVISLQGSIVWHLALPLPQFGESSPIQRGSLPHVIFYSAIVINVILNLFNLVPIFPLDGGQVARQTMVIADPWNGVRKSLILSLVAAVGMILISLQLMENVFLAVFFGFLAFSNFQELQGPRW
jgi:stage IV sporulation protein FB